MTNTTNPNTTEHNTLSQQNIAFIGGGNMARSLIGGLIANDYNTQNIRATDPAEAQLQLLRDQFAIQTDTSNLNAVQQADVVVLAVKPQMLRTVAVELADAVQQKQPLIVSIAAGIREPDLNHWLGDQIAIVRCMPNTPALIQAGATALFANPLVTDEQRQIAESILNAAGITVWVEDEALLDSVTALSGSGPAYFFLIIEILQKVGQDLGLSPEQARQLTLQTAVGATRMAMESGEDAALLRQRVTSPGGTTERALEILQQGDIETLFKQALTGAYQRCAELSDSLGGKA